MLYPARAERAVLAGAAEEAAGEPGDKVPRRDQHELLPDPPDGDGAPEAAEDPRIRERGTAHERGAAMADGIHRAGIRDQRPARDPRNIRGGKTGGEAAG